MFIFIFSVVEGLFLFDIGLSPYAGTVYHQAPLLLYLSPFISSSFSFLLLPILFISVDVWIGYMLVCIARKYGGDEEENRDSSSYSASIEYEVPWFKKNAYALAALYPCSLFLVVVSLLVFSYALGVALLGLFALPFLCFMAVFCVLSCCFLARLFPCLPFSFSRSSLFLFLISHCFRFLP